MNRLVKRGEETSFKEPPHPKKGECGDNHEEGLPKWKLECDNHQGKVDEHDEKQQVGQHQ